MLALYGPSGVGKSTVIQRIADRARAQEPNPSFTPVIIVQASPEDIGAQARLDFYRQDMRIHTYPILRPLFPQSSLNMSCICPVYTLVAAPRSWHNRRDAMA